jgi:flavin reductase (DIM6/NTAB) family NADH-FMN oxidoreductase RutF
MQRELRSSTLVSEGVSDGVTGQRMTILDDRQESGMSHGRGRPACRPPAATQMADAPHEALRGAFISAMRHVAAAVTVVTTDGPAGHHGATVSAFAAVSADPPTVLVCLRSASRICAAVISNRLFTVSALTDQDQDVARRFAGEFDAATSDRFAGIRLEAFPCLAPGIAGASGFACSVTRTVEQDTHTIVIGRVMRVAHAQRGPLLYHDGAYGQLLRGAAPGVTI